MVDFKTLAAGSAALGLYNDYRERKKQEEAEFKDTSSFNMQGFIESVKSDGMRVARQHQYQATMHLSNAGVSAEAIKKIPFMCHTAAIPGYRAKTTMGKIYGLQYEVVTGVEYDPLWLTFYSDILHKIPEAFFTNAKLSMLDADELISNQTSFSPKYKDDYKFMLELEIMDENFQTVVKYILIDCFIKTVQQLPLSYNGDGVSSVAVEVVFERIISERQDNHTRNITSTTQGSQPAPSRLKTNASGLAGELLNVFNL